MKEIEVDFNNSGWIKLHRKILGSEVWTDDKLFKIWIWCLLKANYEDKKFIHGNTRIFISKGSFITGGIKGSKECGISHSSFWRKLKLLQDMDNIRIISVPQYSIVEIKRWNDYQMVQKVENKKSKQSNDSNEVSSDPWKTNGKQMETDKNEKNEKKPTVPTNSSSLDALAKKVITPKIDYENSFKDFTEEINLTFSVEEPVRNRH
jgi:hypothetical protein